MLITRNVIWQRVSPAPLVPAQANGPLSSVEGGFEADDLGTSDRGDGGVVYELDDSPDHLNDLDVTWGFDLESFIQERVQQAPTTGKAGEGLAETMDSSQGGAVDASSTPLRRVKTA